MDKIVWILIVEQDVEDLKQIYSSVDDIDFIVGALLETPVKGTKVGPMARCIIFDSFRRYKSGDRFFHDVRGQPGSFTPGKTTFFKKIKKNIIHSFISLWFRISA